MGQSPLAPGSDTILKFTPTGVKNTFATGLTNPRGLAFDSSGNLFVAESKYGSGRRYLEVPSRRQHADCFRLRLQPPAIPHLRPAAITRLHSHPLHFFQRGAKFSPGRTSILHSVTPKISTITLIVFSILILCKGIVERHAIGKSNANFWLDSCQKSSIVAALSDCTGLSGNRALWTATCSAAQTR
jgi:hypothetical protein